MDTERLLLTLGALADPSRFHILQILAGGAIGTCCDRMEAYENGRCVADVVTATGLSQPTVSHHLRVLATAGLIRKEARGPWTCYFPDASAIDELMQALKAELVPRGPISCDCR